MTPTPLPPEEIRVRIRGLAHLVATVAMEELAAILMEKVCSFCGETGLHAHTEEKAMRGKWITRAEYLSRTSQP